MSLRIVVYGQPAPQGSKRHVGRGVMVESSKALKPWREAVKWAALESVRLTMDEHDVRPIRAGVLDGALAVQMVFTFTRPRGHYGTGRNAAFLRPSAPRFPQGPPDLSKLVRATEDAITDAGVWRDDARVVTCHAHKVYSDSLHPDALDVPGAVVRIEQVSG